MFDPIYNFFGWILAFFYGLIPNLGVAIILLTVSVMLVLFPLTAKQAKAMMHMQRAQPEIKKIQAKYKGDKQKQNEEVMKFYQENKINPLAGCLPLLVQMPIFFALFHVMRTPYKYLPSGSDLYAAFCSNPAGKIVGEAACGKPPLPNHLEFLGMDLSQNATGVTGGFMAALPYFLLVGLVIITGFLQSRQSRRNAPNMNSQMAIITTILPIGFGLFSLQFPAGLVLYFLVSNLWRLGQQELIMRKITGPMKAAAAIDVKSAPAEPIPPPGAGSSAGALGGAAGGLRKLFQLPSAASSADAGRTEDGGAAKNGTGTAENGSATSTGSTGSKPSTTGGGNGGSAGGNRRKNAKRRKRR